MAASPPACYCSLRTCWPPRAASEQLFAVFDSTNGQGKLVYEDFIVGLATICRGTPEERAGFIFRLFDIRRCVALVSA